MKTIFRLFAGVAVAGFACMGSLGCHQLYADRTVVVVYIGALDEGKQVHLVKHVEYNTLLKGPEHNFAELYLEVTPLDASVGKNVVARRSPVSSDEWPHFWLGKLEARTDPNRQRVWIVDKDAGRIVASLDCSTGATTGPQDESPPWAELDTGTVLAELAP